MATTTPSTPPPPAKRSQPAGAAATARTAPSAKPGATAPAARAEQTSDRPPCPKCGTTEPWGLASWCPRCGYYPQLGTVIDPEGRSGWEDQPATVPVNIFQALPPWAWVCGGGVVAIFFASLICRVAIPAESSIRLLWSLLQFVIGMVIAGCAQVAAYLFAVPKSDKIHPFDMIIKPIEIWKPTIHALPATASRVCLISWGVTALVCALFVTGGIPWGRAFDDWGFEKRAQKNLVQSIVEKAREQRDGQAESLEEAMNEFTGEATDQLEPEVPRVKTDCLILGYTKTPDSEDLASLVLASTPRGVLEIIGTMTAETIPREERRRLLRRMATLETGRPLIKNSFSATWLEPKLMIRVAHEDWTKDKKLKKPIFEEMLKDIDQD